MPDEPACCIVESPCPARMLQSWGTLWPVNLGTTGLPLRRFLETSEPSLVLLRRLRVAGGQVGGPILMESGMRHRKVNQSTQQPSLSVYQRAVSYRLSLLLLWCTAASSPLTVLGRVEGA